MRATASLSVILVAAILALGDGAFLVEDNRDAQRGKMATEFVIHIAMVVMHARSRQQMAYLLIDILPLFPTANTEEMEDIQRALNELNDGAAELRTFDI